MTKHVDMVPQTVAAKGSGQPCLQELIRSNTAAAGGDYMHGLYGSLAQAGVYHKTRLAAEQKK